MSTISVSLAIGQLLTSSWCELQEILPTFNQVAVKLFFLGRSLAIALQCLLLCSWNHPNLFSTCSIVLGLFRGEEKQLSTPVVLQTHTLCWDKARLRNGSFLPKLGVCCIARQHPKGVVVGMDNCSLQPGLLYGLVLMPLICCLSIGVLWRLLGQMLAYLVL